MHQKRPLFSSSSPDLKFMDKLFVVNNCFISCCFRYLLGVYSWFVFCEQVGGVVKHPDVVLVPSAFSEGRAANRRFVLARQSVYFYATTCPALRVAEMLESSPVILPPRLDGTLDSLPVYCGHIWRFTFHSISSTGLDLTRLQLFSRTLEHSLIVWVEWSKQGGAINATDFLLFRLPP